MRNAVDDLFERSTELGEATRAEGPGNRALGRVRSLVDDIFELSASFRETDDPGAAVGGVRGTHEVPEILHIAQHVVYGLFGDMNPLGQLGGSEAIRGRIAE